MVDSVQRVSERGAHSRGHKEDFHGGAVTVLIFRVKVLKNSRRIQFMLPCFSQITRNEILNYRQQIEDFAKCFYHEGPGSVGEDLDSGKNMHDGLRY